MKYKDYYATLGVDRSASADDVAASQRMLGAFGLDAIYGQDPMPNADASVALMRTHRAAVAS